MNKTSFTHEDDEYLLEWYKRITNQELADSMNKTKNQIKSRYQYLMRLRGQKIGMPKKSHIAIR